MIQLFVGVVKTGEEEVLAGRLFMDIYRRPLHLEITTSRTSPTKEPVVMNIHGVLTTLDKFNQPSNIPRAW